jgi:hypothetical protein
VKLFLLRAGLSLGILWLIYRLTGCASAPEVEPEPVTPQPIVPEAPAWIQTPARLVTELYDYGPDGRPIWKITFLDSVHPTLPAGSEQLGIDWPHLREHGRVISSSKQTGPVRVYQDPGAERPQSRAPISEPAIALVRNPWTGETLPRGEFDRWRIAGADCTIAPLDSLGPIVSWDGRNRMTGKAERGQARVPIAGEWVPLTSATITIPAAPDPIPDVVLSRVRAGAWDEEYRNPGYLILGCGGQSVMLPVDSLDGMYREPDGWVRKVRIYAENRQWFLRVNGRDSTVIRSPWIPGWSHSYEN